MVYFIIEVWNSKFYKAFVLLFVFVMLGSCSDMDTLMPSTGNYKINLEVSGTPLDDCTFIKSGDMIQPGFDNHVSDDPDITSLVIFMKNSEGREIGGSKVMYKLEYASDNFDKTGNDEFASDDINAGSNNYLTIGDTLVIPVISMDKLPPYPMLKYLSTGWYTMVYQVMSDNDNLYRNDQNFFYLADKYFLFRDVNVYLPGILTGTQYIPKDTAIMLEAKIEFDAAFDPYIIWYNGKKVIGEGKYSENGGKLLWVTPNQSSFLLLRTEVFPITNRQGLAGYSKQISLPVSSRSADFTLLSKNTANIMYLYLFEGGLSESLSPSSAGRELIPSGKIQWIPANGCYGLASGPGNSYSLPNIPLSGDGNKTGEFLFNFKPLSGGVMFTAQFDQSSNVYMKLSHEENMLVLTLESPEKTVSQYKEISSGDIFISAKIKFVIYDDRLEAKLILYEDFNIDEINIQPILIDARLNGDIKTSLGSQNINTVIKPVQQSLYTALWNEFAFITDLSKQ
ncbi:MAG: hypothetical protein LBB81_02670 [Treponema sp.]|jgi:hypothetical protein|nr:hypothetical protein [Treponema sp.]